MIRTQVRSGIIEYSGRAFQQDAQEAMRGDIVRGLIELITNCDDAYINLEGSGQGKVVIEVEHRTRHPWKVIVRDRATGMSSDDLINKITRLGYRTSGFENGLPLRGNLGRGAKDLAAFGEVIYKSIYDGQYAELRLHPDGRWDLNSQRRLTSEGRQKLGITRGNGTVVQIDVDASVTCPRHETLKRKLNCHYQLRDILSDSRRSIHLINLNTSDRDHLKYVFPDLPVVFEKDLDFPGYPEAKASVTIWRFSQRYDDPPSDPGRPSGILIKGLRAIYENTLFSCEGNIHSGWFTGRLICPYIDYLAREYDDRLERGEPQDSRNPVPIISRRRDGLNEEHPFTQSLKQIADGYLRELVEAESERARKSAEKLVTDQTRQAFGKLGRELGRVINEELRDIEAEELPGEGEGVPPALAIIPEQVVVYMGEDKTITVAARKNGVTESDIVMISTEPTGVVEVLTQEVQLRPHKRREDLLVGQIRVRPLLEGEITLLSSKLNEEKADALIEVKPPREIVVEEVIPPETLQFERPSYRISWQRKRNLQILAPADVIAKYGLILKVSSSDEGVVIRSTNTPELAYDDSVEYYTTTVQVEARGLNARSVLTASIGEIEAIAHIHVVRQEEGSSFEVDFYHEDLGIWRAILEQEQRENRGEVQVIKIAARHPALSPYLGEHLEGQHTPICRSIMAEAAADLAARIVVSELFRLRRTTESFDVDRFYREHYKLMTKFLPRFQQILIRDTEAE